MRPSSTAPLDSLLGADVLPFPAPRPEPQHRTPPPVLRLGTRVTVRPRLDHAGKGTVYAVTHSATPVYDVKCDDGRYLRDLTAVEVEALP